MPELSVSGGGVTPTLITLLQQSVAYCQGEGPSQHPGVYLKLPQRGAVVCPYCSQGFEKFGSSTGELA